MFWNVWEQLVRASQHGFRSRAEDSVATDFGGTAWKHVLEEAADEFDSRQSDALHCWERLSR